MTIFYKDREKLEARGRTVAVAYRGPGEFTATYWDEALGAFVTVYDAEPTRTAVDASNELRLRYVASKWKRRPEHAKERLDSLDVTLDEYAKIESQVAKDSTRRLITNVLWRDANKKAESSFEKSCAAQIREWLAQDVHKAPLSKRQEHILTKYLQQNA